MTTRSVIFWNVQRLFGSAGSPIEYALSGDDEAAAASQEAVEAKIDTIAAALDLIAERAGPPLFVGLVEIETDDLSHAIAARVTSAELETVDRLGDDRTGIALDGLNVSALVDSSLVTGISGLTSHVINRTFSTRDVLECHLDLAGLGSLAVFVNHWPSRLSSEGGSRRVSAAHYVNRLVAAETRYRLHEMWDAERKILDLPNADEMRQRAHSPVIVMGDFNDEPFSATSNCSARPMMRRPSRTTSTSRGIPRRSATGPTPRRRRACTTLGGTLSAAAATTIAAPGGVSTTKSCSAAGCSNATPRFASSPTRRPSTTPRP